MVRPAILERRDALAKTPILERIAAMKETLSAAGDEAEQGQNPGAEAAIQHHEAEPLYERRMDDSAMGVHGGEP